MPSDTTVATSDCCLTNKSLPACDITPLHTNLCWKSLRLCKTKTDRADAHTIAVMLMPDANRKFYTNTSYHNGERKSRIRYRFVKLRKRAKH